MRYVVSEIILHTLEDMDPQYPIVTEERKQNFAQLKEQLEKEISEECNASKLRDLTN